jgi:hypothetical protein
MINIRFKNISKGKEKIYFKTDLNLKSIFGLIIRTQMRKTVKRENHSLLRVSYHLNHFLNSISF